jgi:hypothetical protein
VSALVAKKVLISSDLIRSVSSGRDIAGYPPAELSGDPPLSWTSQLARVCAWREPWRDGSEESSRTSSRRMR